ncbi:2-oxoacid ferredoxin oxidoreductase [Clostridium carboxidivorans P7]|uniref:Pyruvate ferredoxin/flavodoxin oxidoreductase, beta subunit n=1 Tax=Clostridium carboxidivorans P7 TaxID=536227 RepID=C6PYZ5_9CLOT|nr:2-oxoacid:ferredoxin oxidoreductase subunit beta [Clostridium carboxidivorans]AKN31334.1 2-oxoacid ferredoxin oxidoreductase [Clostridium carboxidivorans P7]EET85529.1 pyruvate ferredoxin/flavodoxin oxidoreductase, beta subunit [Clostridium carboxidivorans P7]EFG88465.1 2-oxoglutarate ferredoxin oxidoreductase subunit beta [Clostridium carboxidivorans P7]
MSTDKFCTYETAWCPGCGNFSILECLKKALEELDMDPYEVLMVAGIGQAAKTPQYISANSFCGLHGRSLPAAVAAKIANKNLTVIVDTGDGDSYGEGGNHFIHNIRRNVDITHFVHDNQIYGLTKGQASPTSSEGQITDVQPTGSINAPLNPVLLAIAAGAGFVARAFSGDKEHLVSIMKQAILYKGYALVDILQPCVSFNRVNTFAYYKKRVYRLDDSYDNHNKTVAIQKSMEYGDRIPIGVIYQEQKRTFHEKNIVLSSGKPLIDMQYNINFVQKIIEEFI